MTETAKGSKPIDFKNHTRWNYEFRDPSADIEKLFENPVLRMDVPRNCLFGIQTKQEYEKKKRNRVEADFGTLTTEQIHSLLSEHPVHAVALPHRSFDQSLWTGILDQIPYSLIILDGHHRTRYAPKAIKEIPTLILTVDQALRIYKRRYGDDTKAFIKQIEGEVGEALHSFADDNPKLEPYRVYFETGENEKRRIGIVSRTNTLVPITSSQKKE